MSEGTVRQKLETWELERKTPIVQADILAVFLGDYYCCLTNREGFRVEDEVIAEALSRWCPPAFAASVLAAGIERKEQSDADVDAMRTIYARRRLRATPGISDTNSDKRDLASFR
jgi:hypothetical protein